MRLAICHSLYHRTNFGLTICLSPYQQTSLEPAICLSLYHWTNFSLTICLSLYHQTNFSLTKHGCTGAGMINRKDMRTLPQLNAVADTCNPIPDRLPHNLKKTNPIA
ncbi:hypothetical protein EVA_17834 [gut metagenome]|uniref:Uncharacterized protein n=1 Tax=gut metagenome TaxID=749906 RepID=J9G3G6_9ZZZZ